MQTITPWMLKNHQADMQNTDDLFYWDVLLLKSI